MYPKNSFDLVHGRYMLGSIRDWDRYFAQAFKYPPLPPTKLDGDVDAKLDMSNPEVTLNPKSTF